MLAGLMLVVLMKREAGHLLVRVSARVEFPAVVLAVAVLAASAWFPGLCVPRWRKGHVMRSESLIVREQAQTKTLGRDRGEVPAARRFVRAVLAGHPAVGDAELLVCELVTNAVVHADGAGQVTVEVLADGPGVHVEVADDGTAGVPAWREPAAGAEGGRGFQLVNEIAARWGFVRDQAGTCCWFDLDDSQAL